MRGNYLTLVVINLVRVIDQGKHARLPLVEMLKLCNETKVDMDA